MIMKLKDICDFQSGGTPSKGNSEFFNGTIPWITTTALNNSKINEACATEWITESAIVGSAAKIVPAHSIMVGTRVGVGKVAINTVKMSTNQDIISLLNIDERNWSKEYLCKFIQSKFDYLNSQSRGATIKGIKIDVVANLKITQIPLNRQKEVSKTIDKVQKILEDRKKQLQGLDKLVKARFVEMFGDPQINPYGWEVVNISEIIAGKVSNGFFAKRDDYCNDGNVSVLGVANIVNRMYSNIDELPRTNANSKDIEKYEVKYGDMLFCRSSLVVEGIGKASIIPKDVKKNILFECHVIRLPLDLNKCVPEFIQTLSTMEFFRNQIIAQSKTATMTTIGQDGILKSNIILPSLERQKEFLDFVAQVDKSKAAVQKALDETQLLFDSLMQEYFG